MEEKRKQIFHKNPKNPLISVVIPAFNEEKYLPQTLEALGNQSFKQFELIVVDNGSDDRTAEIAKKFGARVILEKRKGVSFARQKGFLSAKGEIIATTDADTIVPKNWLETIVKEFEIRKNLVAYGGLSQLYSGPGTAKLAWKFLCYPTFYLDRVLSGGWSLPGFNMAIKKSAFYKIGGFKGYLQVGEDLDISSRLNKIGQVVLDKKLIVHMSGRRFNQGLFSGLMAYLPYWVGKNILKTEIKRKHPPIRDEHSSVLLSKDITGN